MPNLPLSGIQTTNDTKVTNYVQGFYKKNFPVSGDEYDVVRSFFLGRTKGNKTAADALTSSVMTIAINRNIRPVSIIEDFKKYTDNSSFTAALIALINGDRRNTSKLGYAAIPEPDQYVVRNISS